MRYSFVGALLVAGALLASARSATAQDVRAQLLERGAPAEFADQVAAVVASAGAEQLPTEPLVSKALEGWAKRARVPQDRVITALNQYVVRLRTGRDIALEVGFNGAPGPVIAAAAEAVGRGMTRAQITQVMGSAGEPAAAATGLTVASALMAQGLEAEAAIRVVDDAFRGGRPPEDILEFPSALTGLQAQGEDMAQIARRIMQGGGLPSPTAPGMGGRGNRPPTVPGMSGEGQKKRKGTSGGQ